MKLSSLLSFGLVLASTSLDALAAPSYDSDLSARGGLQDYYKKQGYIWQPARCNLHPVVNKKPTWWRRDDDDDLSDLVNEVLGGSEDAAIQARSPQEDAITNAIRDLVIADMRRGESGIVARSLTHLEARCGGSWVKPPSGPNSLLSWLTKPKPKTT